MKCPYCNNEMDKGYIQSRDDLYWTEKTRLLSALPPLRGEWTSIENPAVCYRCIECKKLVIDYGEK